MFSFLESFLNVSVELQFLTFSLHLGHRTRPGYLKLWLKIITLLDLRVIKFEFLRL